jgi:hypothetical protein
VSTSGGVRRIESVRRDTAAKVGGTSTPDTNFNGWAQRFSDGYQVYTRAADRPCAWFVEWLGHPRRSGWGDNPRRRGRAGTRICKGGRPRICKAAGEKMKAGQGAGGLGSVRAADYEAPRSRREHFRREFREIKLQKRSCQQRVARPCGRCHDPPLGLGERHKSFKVRVRRRETSVGCQAGGPRSALEGQAEEGRREWQATHHSPRYCQGSGQHFPRRKQEIGSDRSDAPLSGSDTRGNHGTDWLAAAYGARLRQRDADQEAGVERRVVPFE